MRCFGDGNPLYERYHDEEWGLPVRDEQGLFERISLEAFQSGLAWITILRKREGFRRAFAGFDPEVVAAFGRKDVARLLADVEIVRNRAKIEATIANARATLALRETGDAAPRADLGLRAASSQSSSDELGRGTGADGRVEGAGEGTQGGGLPLRRPDDRLRRDAGLRPRRRPPRGLPQRQLKLACVRSRPSRTSDSTASAARATSASGSSSGSNGDRT